MWPLKIGIFLLCLSGAIQTSAGGNCDSLVINKSSWWRHMGATLRIPVSQSLSTYSIRITTDVPLTNIVFWSADVTPTTGTVFTVTPKRWFSGAAANTNLDLGFQIQYSGSVVPSFTMVQFNDGLSNNNLCSGSAPITTTTTTTTTTSTTKSPVTQSGGNCDSVLTGISSWSGATGATLRVPVTSALSTYTIKITTDIPLTGIQFWNGDVSPTTGTSFTLTPKSWFGGQAANTNLDLGFQMQYSGSVVPKFTTVTINDGSSLRNVCSGGNQPTPAPTTTSTVRPQTTTSTVRPQTTTSTARPTTISTAQPATTTTNSGVCTDKKIVCYYPNWAYYRTGTGKYLVDNIDTSLCTHVVYAFAILDPTTYTMKAYDTWLDLDLANYAKFVQLKQKSPGVKVLVAIGGWNDSRNSKYSTMLADPAKRANFVTEAVQFIQKYGFDGLDLDYEYPGYAVASDKAAFTAWVRELKTAFQPYGWELTAAVGASSSTVDAGYEVAEISKYLDAIHLMTYDFHGSWENRVEHHSPLYARTAGDVLSVDYSVNYWLSKGAPKSKLVMGIPTYGQSWTLSSSANTPGSPASGAGATGPITQQNGYLGYNEICLNIKQNGWTVVKDPSGKQGPYAYKGNQWVGYDDPAFAGVKAKYILDKGLGGAMFWDLATDDFNNLCGGGKNPIVSAVHGVLAGKSC